jgi:hypothetical protein
VNVDRGFPSGLAGAEFDAVACHYTLFVPGTGPGGWVIGREFHDYLRTARAYKVAFFQDEYHHVAKRLRFISETGIDCVYTMLEQPWADQVYLERGSASKAVPHFPSYVGDELLSGAERFAKPDSERAIDVGYRGRPSPVYWGRGAQEKSEIGTRFAEAAAGRLALDIANGESDRIYGEDWHRFMGNCKATLGTESGVSVFDLEDEVLARYEEVAASGGEPGFEDLEPALSRWEGKIPYRTVSPRNFEAAAFGTTQILFEGSYSGLMEPMTHYIPLRKDLSNVEEAIERFSDEALRAELARNARRDLIDSGENSYERLIAGFDAVLAEAGVEARPGTLAPPIGRFPPGRSLAHSATGAWLRLRQRHPRIWTALHLLSRPLVVPARAIARLRADG